MELDRKKERLRRGESDQKKVGGGGHFEDCDGIPQQEDLFLLSGKEDHIDSMEKEIIMDLQL